MPAIATTPVFAASIVARLPLAMLTIGMLVHVQHVTDSFAVAGLVSGTRSCSPPRSSRAPVL